jgi:hypothetical protein
VVGSTAFVIQFVDRSYENDAARQTADYIYIVLERRTDGQTTPHAFPRNRPWENLLRRDLDVSIGIAQLALSKIRSWFHHLCLPKTSSADYAAENRIGS